MSAEFNAGLARVLEGSLTFDHFVMKTRPHWRRLAKYIMRRWRIPAWTAAEDVEQELQLGAWMAIWNWQPGRGPTLAGYVIYNAVDKAKKECHKWRGALRSGSNADKSRSRFEPSTTQAFGESAEWRVDNALQEAPGQLQAVEEAELNARVLRVCVAWHERLFVEHAVRGGILNEALAGEPTALYECAQRCYASRRGRRKFGSEKMALELVVQASAEVATRYVQQAA